jgi:hypothetical protein
MCISPLTHHSLLKRVQCLEDEKAFLNGFPHLYEAICTWVAEGRSAFGRTEIVMGDVDERLPRPSYKEIRIFVTPYQMLHNRKCQDILLFVYYVYPILYGSFRRGIGIYLQYLTQR